MEQPAAALTLKTFLTERRARITPESTGLPARARGSTGVSRQEVAELLGVSPLWYALFESGSSGRRFSPEFLDRVGEVLRLDASDRATLARLAAATGSAASDNASTERLVAFMADLAEMAREMAAANTVTDASELAFTTLGRLLSSARPAFTVYLVDGDRIEAVAHRGAPRDGPVVGFSKHIVADAQCFGEVKRRGNRAFVVTDVAGDSDLAAYFQAPGCRDGLASLSHARSLIVAPVTRGEELLGTLRIESPFPNAFFEHEATVAEIVGAHLGRAVLAPTGTP